MERKKNKIKYWKIKKILYLYGIKCQTKKIKKEKKTQFKNTYNN